MTDSPFQRIPLDPKEQPILDRVLVIRDHLSLLKQDRSTYVKSADVVKYYTQLVEQVELLNQIRIDKRDEQNRVDTVLDDCFRLISLFFLTIGRNREAPAIYTCVSTVKRLLDHLKEAAFYLPADLRSISDHLDKWQQTIERGKNEHSEQLLTLLEARIDLCKVVLKELKAPLVNMNEKDMRTYEKLVSILRSLSACNARSKVRSRSVIEDALLLTPLSTPKTRSKNFRNNSIRSRKSCMRKVYRMRVKLRKRYMPKDWRQST